MRTFYNLAIQEILDEEAFTVSINRLFEGDTQRFQRGLRGDARGDVLT